MADFCGSAMQESLAGAHPDLHALGVVQYRRRALRLLRAEPEAATVRPAARGRGTPKATPIQRPAPRRAVRRTPPVQAAAVKPVAGLEFDLLLWNCERVLVLEADGPAAELVAAKHQLLNNILRALWPGHAGTELHRHQWPLAGVAADVSAATEWLAAVVAGQPRQPGDRPRPVWLMGAVGHRLLLPEAETPPRLPARVDSQGVNFLLTPSLADMLESAAAKRQTWQLLKPLQRSGGPG